MSFKVVIDRKALAYLSELPEKSQRLIKDKCHALAEDPFPGQGGDKELLHLEFKLYRLHVGRSFTVFYQVCEKDKVIKILEIVTILIRRIESIVILRCSGLRKVRRRPAGVLPWQQATSAQRRSKEHWLAMAQGREAPPRKRSPKGRII